MTFKLDRLIQDILSGVTVSLALVPASVAFSFVAGVDPIIGLYCTVILGLVTSIVGGRPAMISAATGALVVVMVSIVKNHGIEYLFATVVLMGILQILAGLGHLGKFIRLVPFPAILGFVNGLAIVIFISQLDHFKVEAPNGGLTWLSGLDLWLMLGVVGITMAIIQFFPLITKKIPSSLVAVIAVTLGIIFLKIDIKTVGDITSIGGSLPSFHIPQIPLTFETLSIIFPYAFILAAIGLIESLITLSLVDDYTHTHGKGNLECIGQGLGNTIAGFLGAMGGCATVGPTMINLKSGGQTRISGISAALSVLIFILFASKIIEIVPMAALVGVMFMVVIATFAWSTFSIIGKIPKMDALVIIAVTFVTVIEDLATAVFIGVIISALVFAWEHAKHIGVKTYIDDKGQKIYKLYGPLFFGSITNFLDFFDPKTDPKEVIIEFKHSRVCDHSALDAIDSLAEKYMKEGRNLHLRHLSPECRDLLAKAGDLVEVNVIEDPTYHIVTDKLD